MQPPISFDLAIIFSISVYPLLILPPPLHVLCSNNLFAIFFPWHSAFLPVKLLSNSSLQHINTIITTDEVLLHDLFDDTIITIIEEFQRRLPPATVDFIDQGEDEEDIRVQFEAQTSESIGIRCIYNMHNLRLLPQSQRYPRQAGNTIFQPWGKQC